jgi:hypothetical protein
MPTHQGKTQTDIVIGDGGEESRLISVLPKQRFEYSYLGTAATLNVCFHEAIDTTGYKSAWLLLRVHSHNLTAGQSIVFGAIGTDPSPYDPNEFWDVTSILSTTVNSTVASPALLTATHSNLFPFLKVAMTVTQSTLNTAFYADLSADLVLRRF